MVKREKIFCFLRPLLFDLHQLLEVTDLVILLRALGATGRKEAKKATGLRKVTQAADRKDQKEVARAATRPGYLKGTSKHTRKLKEKKRRAKGLKSLKVASLNGTRNLRVN